MNDLQNRPSQGQLIRVDFDGERYFFRELIRGKKYNERYSVGCCAR